jgi:hypothetical protein
MYLHTLHMYLVHNNETGLKVGSDGLRTEEKIYSL